MTSERRKRRIERIVERDGNACWLCRAHVDLKLPRTHPMHATVDHVLPKSKGGSNALANLKLAHSACNRKRGNKLIRQPPVKHPAEPQAKDEFPLPFLWPRRTAS